MTKGRDKEVRECMRQQPVRRRVGTRGKEGLNGPERTGFQSQMYPWRFTVVGPQLLAAVACSVPSPMRG